MRKVKNVILLVTLLMIAGFQQADRVVTIHLIGDSTMADYAANYDEGKDYHQTRYPMTGWGQVFQHFFQGTELTDFSGLFDADSVDVEVYARGGRSTRTFFQEGRWREVYEALRPGDLVLMQFGHNDAAENKPERYVDIAGYQEFLRLYVDQSRHKGAVPIILTPVARNYPWRKGHLENVHGAYPQAAREVSEEMNTLFIDLNELSIDAFSEMGREYVSEAYFMNLPPGKYEAYPDGLKDNTHFTPDGAKAVAALVFEAMKDLKEPGDGTYDMIVAKDGSGDFATVQEAIDAVPHLRKNRTRIFIKSGVYKEKLIIPSTRTNISFIGEDANTTILTYDDYASRKNRFGEEIGTSGSSSLYIYGDGFEARNLTFENSAGEVGQAVAVRIDGDKVKFENCRFLGNQDTLYPHGRNSRQYYKNCYIEGTVDYIFGWSTAVFEDCELYSKRAGYITAASTEEQSEHGFVFINCKISGNAPVGSVYLGRPWRPHAQTVFIGCELSEIVHPEGWHNWGSKEKESTAFYAEYNNSGPGYQPKQRVQWAHILTAEEASGYTLSSIFKDWDPATSAP